MNLDRRLSAVEELMRTGQYIPVLIVDSEADLASHSGEIGSDTVIIFDDIPEVS